MKKPARKEKKQTTRPGRQNRNDSWKPDELPAPELSVGVSPFAGFIPTLFWISFSACVLVILWAFYASGLVVLQDVPDHIARASILRDYFSSEHIRRYFSITPIPSPYMFPDILNAVFLLFLSPLDAARAYGALSVMAMVAGVAFFGSRCFPQRIELSLLCVTIAFSNVLLKGNCTYLYSMGVLFALLGYWWPVRGKETGRELFITAAGGMVLYLFHLFSLLLWFSIFLLSFFVRLVAARGRGPSSSARPAWSGLLPVAPAMALTAVYILWDSLSSGALTLSSTGWVSLKTVGNLLQSLDVFFTISSPGKDLLPFLPVGALYLLMIALRRPRVRFASEEAVIFVALALACLFLAPNFFSLDRPSDRLLFPLLFWGLLLMGNGRETVIKIKIPGIAVEPALRLAWIFCLVAVCWSRAVVFQEFMARLEPRYREHYRLLENVPPKSLLCAVRYDSKKSFRHFYKYSTAINQTITPDLFSAKFSCLRYKTRFPGGRPGDTITDAMLRTYDYFMVYGWSPNLQRLANSGILSEAKSGPDYGLFRNNRVQR